MPSVAPDWLMTGVDTAAARFASRHLYDDAKDDAAVAEGRRGASTSGCLLVHLLLLIILAAFSVHQVIMCQASLVALTTEPLAQRLSAVVVVASALAITDAVIIVVIHWGGLVCVKQGEREAKRIREQQNINININWKASFVCCVIRWCRGQRHGERYSEKGCSRSVLNAASSQITQ